MAKVKTIFVCSNCGFESPKWAGKCPDCEQWNSFTEEVSDKKSLQKNNSTIRTSSVYNLKDINILKEERIFTGINEFDRVAGGGLMTGSIILIGGDPGIGKSTLVMQISTGIKHKVLYVTGEESINQIKSRSSRLKISNENIYILAETNLENIIEKINETEPELVVIDSIQTMYKSNLDNTPGTVTQIKECAYDLMNLAKAKNITVIIIGHVTKEGAIAGPMILEHIVDTVMHFEGDKHQNFRILRAIKNRFGSTNEIGVFEMNESGLSEINNPSDIFLSDAVSNVSGSVISASMEGTRPILFEVQALVTPSHFGNPQRVATGFDYRKLSILLAVLEKRAGLRLGQQNVFLNMVGGIKLDDPAVDLAVCCSIASSIADIKCSKKFVIAGEVGLGGEVRSVSHIQRLVIEAEKLGFESIILPQSNFSKLNYKGGIKLIPVRFVRNAIDIILQQN